MDYRNLHQMNLYDVFGDSPWTQEDVFLKDRDYMKKMCPKQNREMLRWVEDVCDEEEYDGSCMYDEYPDITAMNHLLDKAYTRAGRPEPEDWSRALLTSLLYDEICYRRNRRREFKQRLYPR